MNPLSTELVSDAPTPEPLPTVYELKTASTQKLRADLARSLTITAQHLSYLAAVWRELEQRGEDLSDLRVGLAVYLPMIAARRLDAAAVVRFAGRPTVLNQLVAMPIEQQQDLARGTPVPVLTAAPDGSFTTTELPVHALTAAQIKMVFGEGRVRSASEQLAQIEASRLRSVRRARPGDAKSKVRYDRRTDTIRIGRASATVGEVLAALLDASKEEGSGIAEELSAAAVTKLTDSQHRMLKVRAAEAGCSVQDLTHGILVRHLKL